MDFRRRVGELPRTIFSVHDEPPKWPSEDDDDDMGLESISEPDDGPDKESEEDADREGDEQVEQFFDARSVFVERARSEEGDTEEDPMDPITPLPGSRFEIQGFEEEDVRFEEGASFIGMDGGDDGVEEIIEGDWVDPSPETSTPSAVSENRNGSNGRKKSRKERDKDKKQISIPVPAVSLPFPVSMDDSAVGVAVHSQPPHERARNSSSNNKGGVARRMHTARARDGGRTQSGGVKGLLTDD